MKRYGLIGEKLGHSFSPLIHREFGDYAYDLCEVPAEGAVKPAASAATLASAASAEPATSGAAAQTIPAGLAALLADETYGGFNVTIPYKKTVIPLCDSLSPQAEAIGSVNTIVRQADGKLVGHNTDYFGFVYLLESAGISVKNRKCLVLGNGGASLTVQTALADLGAASVIVISRRGPDNYDNLLMRHADAEIIVNTTPVGMYPHNGEKLISLADFPHCCGAADLIYNPHRTALILDAESRGIPAAGGLAMLAAQAKKASELFTGLSIADERCEEVVELLRKQTMNFILIGMPGSGKTTVGRRLAAQTGRKLVDTDALIVEREGRAIPEIFASEGEDYFRRVETEVLQLVCKESGLVISAGGGIVKRPENRDVMRQNGHIIWVQRELDKLAIAGRPLSLTTPLEQLYAERRDAYENWSDEIFVNEERK